MILPNPDRDGIAIRAVTMRPTLHEKYGITATARASFYVYSLPENG